MKYATKFCVFHSKPLRACWLCAEGNVPLTIGRKIEGLRKAKGLTQEKFGERLGVNRSTVDRWEKPDADPSTTRLKEIGEELQLRADCSLMPRGAPGRTSA